MAGTDDYLRIADAVAADIAAGRLRPGDRLATQRAFARTHGIANSTAHRVYRELARRGLTVGEVGRGTFVRAAQHTPGPALAEPAAPDAGTRVNLELNYPVVPEQAALLAEGMAPLLRPDALDAALRPIGPAGHSPARTAAAALLTCTGFAPDPERVLFAGNGRHAVAGAMAALVPPGGRLGVEAYTYPLVKAIAARIGVTLVPLAMDAQGLRPEAVRAAHRSAPLHAVYLQPTLHNPLGVTMPAPRRVELSDTLRELDLWAVEDAIWLFLHQETDLPPLAALAPERTVLVDSLSKRLAPGLTVGLVLPPAARRDAVASALRSGGWTATGFALEAVTRWLADGTVDRIVRAKRRDAADRQALIRRHLDGFAVSADPRSYFAWWELPEGWRAESFLAAAARRGIAVTPGTAFAVAPEGAQGAAPAPHAVRLALAGAPPDLLPYALSTLAAVARGTPEDAFPE
ncbi:PLP-dependent aminotransferase family protein [Streptomyces violens]|uniref:aminotransferase-like domain-containing protein n=1 Tax=Streptomyces violens TaxID=66377 RepID=UPI0004C11E66|nr:PLP-dependent aminotransferase family protein [Streptomyces violens]